MQMETLNSIFLGCGKPARRTESCDEHISEKMGDAPDWSLGDSGCCRGRWKHPSPMVGEGAGAERSWTFCLVSPRVKRSLWLEACATCVRGSLPSTNVLWYGRASQWQIVLKSYFSGESCN